MEKLVETGKARAIGVSNFGIRNLETLLESAKVVPAVDQIELHVNCSLPFLLLYRLNTTLTEIFRPLH